MSTIPRTLRNLWRVGLKVNIPRDHPIQPPTTALLTSCPPTGFRPPDAVYWRHQGRYADWYRPLWQQVLREPGRRATLAHALGRLPREGI